MRTSPFGSRSNSAGSAWPIDVCPNTRARPSDCRPPEKHSDALPVIPSTRIATGPLYGSTRSPAALTSRGFPGNFISDWRAILSPPVGPPPTKGPPTPTLNSPTPPASAPATPAPRPTPPHHCSAPLSCARDPADRAASAARAYRPRRSARFGLDCGDHQLSIDQADVEPRLSVQVEVVGGVIRRRRNHGEVRKTQASQQVREHRAKLARRFRVDCLGTKIGPDPLPFRAVEGGIEMAVLDDLPDGVEGLPRPVGLRRGRVPPEQHGQQQRRHGGAARLHLIRALIAAGGSNADGSTWSYSTIDSVIFCSTPMTCWVTVIAWGSLPNVLYSPSMLVIVSVPIGDSRVLMLPARRPVATS